METDGLTGKRLAAARKNVQLSQRALAEALGISVRTIQNYEAGRFVPYRHLNALARLLERSPTWLLYGHEHEADQLLAKSRAQRSQLRENMARLAELREQLAGNGGPGA